MSDSRGYRHPFNDCTFYLGGVGGGATTSIFEAEVIDTLTSQINPALSLSDLAMSQFSAELRRKPDWWRTHYNRRHEWAQEACDRVWDVILPSTTITQVKLNDNQIQYVLDELAGYAALYDSSHKCDYSRPSSFERIWESDSLIEPSTLADLNSELASLVPKDVRLAMRGGISSIGLIDPYRYPLIYGKTVSSRDQLPISIPSEDLYSISHRFALLPTDIQISASQTIEFLSYINNLHPSHRHLYHLLQTTLKAFIPLFEHTLTDLHRINPLHQRIPGQSWYSQWDEPEAQSIPTTTKDGKRMKRICGNGYLGGLEDRRHVVTLAGRKVQVIIAASEIRVWLNYSASRRGLSTIAYIAAGSGNEERAHRRVRLLLHHNGKYQRRLNKLSNGRHLPRGFGAGDNGATLRTWGLSDGDPCHQYVGSVRIREGLAIVFPNIYQFRHKPVRLADPSKPGLLRMVSFLLVDPDIPPIPSTATVGLNSGIGLGGLA
ncbi:hypothetical protein BDZ89DRAFT_1049319 [Hymenopellis radicata]|nr:hypothetical protein BDZ89DRAFT_1049319 [Hymenopellis radicata]